MIRRIALAAVMAALCAALVVPASAFTRRQAICVKGARVRAKDSASQCKTAAQTQLANDLTACLDNSGCVSGCLTTQATCVSNTQQDPNDPTMGSKPCIAKCKVTNATDSAACSTDPDPVGCVAKTQLALFVCNQACAAAAEPALIDCNGNFNDCLQTCAGPDTTTTTTLP